jgi:hypothetical protein
MPSTWNLVFTATGEGDTDRGELFAREVARLAREWGIEDFAATITNGRSQADHGGSDPRSGTASASASCSCHDPNCDRPLHVSHNRAGTGVGAITRRRDARYLYPGFGEL